MSPKHIYLILRVELVQLSAIFYSVSWTLLDILPDHWCDGSAILSDMGKYWTISSNIRILGGVSNAPLIQTTIFI